MKKRRITLAMILKARDILDKQAVPTKGRQFYDITDQRFVKSNQKFFK